MSPAFHLQRLSLTRHYKRTAVYVCTNPANLRTALSEHHFPLMFPSLSQTATKQRATEAVKQRQEVILIHGSSFVYSFGEYGII